MFQVFSGLKRFLTRKTEELYVFDHVSSIFGIKKIFNSKDRRTLC